MLDIQSCLPESAGRLCLLVRGQPDYVSGSFQLFGRMAFGVVARAIVSCDLRLKYIPAVSIRDIRRSDQSDKTVASVHLTKRAQDS